MTGDAFRAWTGAMTAAPPQTPTVDEAAAHLRRLGIIA
jgi:hypothetical protein